MITNKAVIEEALRILNLSIDLKLSPTEEVMLVDFLEEERNLEVEFLKKIAINRGGDVEKIRKG